MTNVFFTADWHLGATDMRLMGRPFLDADAMADRLVREHNAMVDPDDIVYVLGDALHDRRPREILDADRAALSELHGDLILLRGNHDWLPDRDLARYFAGIVEEGQGVELVIDGLMCWLTHYPLCARPDRFNLVGHIHDRWKVQKNMLNVGVDVHHFQPVPADRIGFYFRAICEFYDADVWVADHPANTAHADRGVAGSYLEARR